MLRLALPAGPDGGLIGRAYSEGERGRSREPTGGRAMPVADGDGEQPLMARVRLNRLRVAGRVTARDGPPVVPWLSRRYCQVEDDSHF